jgi:Fe-S oxidoreductase/predicted DNA-binding transcriptional regulator YafY
MCESAGWAGASMTDGMSRAMRLQRLEELLLSTPNGYTVQELADWFGIHRTTAWRDINELSLDAPVQEIDHRYRIDRKDYITNLRLTGGESLMLYLALGRVLGRWSQIPPMLAEAIQKVSLAMRDQAADRMLESLDSARSGIVNQGLTSRIWDTLIRAWLEQITCRITYQDINHSVVEKLDVQPYIFEPAQLTEGIYMVGWSATDDFPGIWLVDRMLDAHLTIEHFERPAHNVIDFMFRSLWETEHGGSTEVRLRFHDPLLAQRIRGTVWLPSQSVVDLPNGGVEWCAEVRDVFELVPWIRSWGPACEVVSPAGLQSFIERAVRDFGGVTMTIAEAPRARTFSDEFYASLQELFGGEKIRTCLQCSTCSGICPNGLWMDYPPRTMISALRANEFDDVMESDSAWLCVSCYACTEACPATIPLTAGLMTRTKEELVLAGNVPEELQEAFENTQRYGNAMGHSRRKRADWAQELEPEIPLITKLGRPVNVLWYVGEYGSYHPRVMPVSVAFAKILHALEIDFAILGPEEVSDGDSVRLAGERGLFETLAAQNGKALSKYTFDEIVTTDPHAYNAFKNEYPSMGISYPVRHYTEFLADNLDALQSLLTEPIDADVTFHDPCYLGRVNKVYDAPRSLIQAIPGVELLEMSHTRENSLCCGGGGGGMWLDGFTWEKSQTRLPEWRVREAMVASPPGEPLAPPVVQTKKKRKVREEPKAAPRQRILAVACPYEAPRFEDATKVVPEAAELIVRDIAELLAQSMGV